MRKILLGAALLALAACTTGQPQETAAVMASGLTVAERTALGYVSLPRCPAGAPVCSDPAIVAKIRQADDAAYTEVKKFEAAARAGGSADATAAQGALTAFTDLLSTPAIQAVFKKGN